MINLDWKKDMDKLYKSTTKNWYKTGKAKKNPAATVNVSLQGKDERNLKS
jgi:hypothetical protein